MADNACMYVDTIDSAEAVRHLTFEILCGGLDHTGKELVFLFVDLHAFRAYLDCNASHYLVTHARCTDRHVSSENF